MGWFTRRRSPKSMQRLYNWLHRFYAPFEVTLGLVLDEVARTKLPALGNTGEMTAVDYGCGSGTWTLRLARQFKQVTGRDQSSGMLSRARRRAEKAGLNITFQEGSLLDIDEDEASVDWAFVSFALHLFPPETEIEILRKLLRAARKGVMVIEHPQTWGFGIALLEWLEGSYYDKFIRIDFASVAEQIGVPHFEKTTFHDCMVLVFAKGSTGTSLRPTPAS